MTVTMRPKRLKEPLLRKPTFTAEQARQMAEANAKARPQAKEPNLQPPASSLQPGSDAGPQLFLAIDKIKVSKDNPRKAFDEEKLAQLAASIERYGILEPLLVRQATAAGAELVAGERRLRAAQRAKLTQVPVRVVALDDAQAAEVRLIENLEREDLTALEEAEGFAALIQRFGYTHEALGQKLGKSQAHVTNRLRLLKLPASWRQRIISREIPPTHARVICAYSDYPELTAQLAREMFGGYHPAPLSLKDFEKRVARIVDYSTRPLQGHSHWDCRLYRHAPIFKPDAAQRAELAVITVGREERATNVKLWEKLQRAHVEALVKKHKAKGDRQAKTKAKGKAAPQQPTPAELRAKAKAQEKQTQKRLAEWRTNWLRRLLARHVLSDARLAIAAVMLRLAAGQAALATKRLAELVDFSATTTRSVAQSYRMRTSAGLCAATAAHAKPIELLVVAVSEWLWDDKDGPQHEFDAIEVEALAAAAAIDLAEAWQRDLAGELTDAFFNLHSKAQCERLQVELLGGPLPEAADKKSAIVARIVADPRAKRKLPKCIQQVSGVRGQGSGKKKSPQARRRKPR